MKKFVLAGCLLIISQVFGQTFSASTYSSTFTTNPVGMTQAPGDERMYVVLRNGLIRIVNTNGSTVAGNWLDISSRVYDNNNEQGLLGLAFDPNYETNGYFYVNYILDTAMSGSARPTRISRFSRSSANPLVADPASEVVLMRVDQPYWNHNGGGLNFGPDGYLYCGLGDGGSGGDPGNRAQNPNVVLGKILRINVNSPTYTSPVSNPFYGQAGYKNEIYTLGMRNPWRFDFDRITGDLWVGDVGQDAYEEINHAERALSDGGENYGWRCYEGNNTYNTSGCGPIGNYFFPKASINQSSGPMCSITMGEVYRGAMMGAIYGKMIFSDYCFDYIWSMTYDTIGAGTYTTVRHNGLPTIDYSIVAFMQDRIGNMFFSSLHDNRIYKLNINTCTPAAVIETAGNRSTICDGGSIELVSAPGTGLTYQWLLNGSPIAGETDSNYTATAAGNYQLIVTNPSCGTNPTDTSSILAVTLGTSIPATLSTNGNDSICHLSSVTLTATPAGGEFLGPYVDNSGEYMAVIPGSGTATYQYTSPSGCVSSASVTIFVMPLPSASFTLLQDTICTSYGVTALGGGLPSGGVYTGTGVNSNNFDPSVGIGDYAILYTYTDAFGCVDTSSDSLTVSGCLSLEDVNYEDFSIFPNPADEMVNVRVSANVNTQAVLEIISLDGKSVLQSSITIIEGQNTYTLNTQALSAGVYMIKLNDGNNLLTRKIVIR